jgi:hypothetical protein
MDISSFPSSRLILYLVSRAIFHTFNSISLLHVFLPCFFAKEAIHSLLLLLNIWCNPKTESTMYKKDLLKEWSNGQLASYGWYLDYLANSTLESKCGLRENFEDAHLDKPTSTDFSFRVAKGTTMLRS